MASRKRLPKDIEIEVLTQSGRRCCICFGLNADFRRKQGQIAHLDRNSQNNSFENLAYLCLEHHDEYDTKTSQSKGWNIGEVKKYRELLHQAVKDNREQAWPGSKKTKETFSHIQSEINSLRNRLKKGIKNVHFLEEKAAAYGVLAIPLEIHNNLTQERELVERLQLELEELLKISRKPGARILPHDAMEEAPIIMIIEHDVHWRAIVAEIATAFGYRTRVYHPLELMAQIETLPLTDYHMSIIGLPTPKTLTTPSAIETWTQIIVKISQTMPIILLTGQDSMSISITTHHSIIENNAETVAIIPKETFNDEWFAKMFKKALVY